MQGEGRSSFLLHWSEFCSTSLFVWTGKRQSCQSTKFSIVLFICYVTQAIHLQTVTSQSTLAFIHCLKRFIARWGLPKCFISNNGKTFKPGSKYLNNMLKDETAQKFLSGCNITWQFNVEMILWCGGAFERMVRSTKRCLRKLIGCVHFSMEKFTTALGDSEAV